MEFYLVWFDDDRKKTTEFKLKEAMDAYERRFHKHPNVILVSEQDRVETSTGIRLRPRSYIRPSNFYVGFEEAA